METTSSATRRVLIISASVRPQRVGPSIAAWVAEVARPSKELACEVVDLADWPLPMEDEPGIPALGTYESEHTRAWSAKIDLADAYIFVTPQYNWGYPASLKNALDHLHREWRHKAAAIVSYGGHGGGKCAAQLRQVLEALKMRVAATMPGLLLSDSAIRAASVEPARELVTHVEAIEHAIGELSTLLDSKPSAAAQHAR